MRHKIEETDLFKEPTTVSFNPISRAKLMNSSTHY